MKQGLKQKLRGAALALSLMMTTPVVAQTPPAPEVSMEYFASKKPESSYLRPSMTFALPGQIKGYSFVEMYKDGAGYLGKTILKRPLGDGTFALDSVTVHGDEPFTRTSLGASVSLPMPKGSYASVKFLPIWIDKSGKLIHERMVIAYAAGVDCGAGVTLASFGDIDVGPKSGSQWGYGELSLMKKFSKSFEAGYCGALIGHGDATPRLEHRLGVKYTF